MMKGMKSKIPKNFEKVYDGKELVCNDYEIISVNKAVIKLDGGIEIPTYEFFVERIDGKYFYYINAKTNEIAKTMKLVVMDDVEKII